MTDGGNDPGWSSWLARLAHNQQVAGSNPAPGPYKPEGVAIARSSSRLKASAA